MNITKQSSALLCLFFSFLQILSAQKVPTITWGEFKVEELQMKNWASDTSAPAAVLGEMGSINMAEIDGYYGFYLNVHRRIKIFKKEAFHYANQTIQVRTKDNRQFVREIKAQTIAPNGMKYLVDKKSIVYEKLSKDVTIIKFTFPNVTEGCILEYKYERQNKGGLFELQDWYFQEAIPIKFSVLNLDLMSNYEYVYLFQGEKNLKSTKPIYDKDNNRTATSFYVENLPALKNEGYVSSIKNYLTYMRFQLAKVYRGGGIIEEVMASWDKTLDDLLSEDQIGKKYLKKSNYNKVAEAAKNAYNSTDSSRAIIQKLYDWVNKNIEWNKDYNIWGVDSPNDIWEKRKGDRGNINFLLVALLRDAGIEANPILLSTREHGVHYVQYPILDQFDHALVYVELPNNQTMLLDAGEPNLPIGLPSEQALNSQGWLMKKKGQQWLDIKPPVSSQTVLALFDITEDGSFKGTLNSSYKGYLAADQRDIFKGDTTGKNKTIYLKTKNPDWQIQDLSCSNLDKANEAFKESITLRIANVVQVNEDLMYVKPTIKSGWETNPFKTEDRTYPVEMPYPSNYQYVLTLSIPEGYKVEELPKNVNLIVPPYDTRFIYQISSDEKTIRLTVRIQINKTVYPAESYKFLKTFFAQISTKLEDMIVLKKIAK